MAGDGTASLSGEPPSPPPHHGMDEGSDTNEQAPEEREDENGHGSDIEEVLVMNDDEQVPTLDNNAIENGLGKVLESGQKDQDSDQTLEIRINTNDDQGENYPPPVTGMEFESYEDAYNYFNSYAKELGFGIRVKSSWTKRNSKEKRGAVLCCNCEGFKLAKEASSRRKETRTGCHAMIRLRLVESNRWRVDESKLEHNHLFDPQRAQKSKSHKRKSEEEAPEVEVRTIKLYRTPLDSLTNRIGNPSDRSKSLKLEKGDTRVLQSYFCRAQLKNPNFVYVMDFNDEGFLRHVFWVEPRARAAYEYFGDVVSLNTTCLSIECEITLLSFVGVNHHGDTILLGCALLSDCTQETHTWLLRVWLTCMLGRAPRTIITDYSKPLEAAISEVFPRAHHYYSLTLVMNHILENLGEVQDFEAFRTDLNRILYNLNKVDEFEGAWEEMTQKFDIKDHELLRTLYEDKEKWAPVYSKETFFAGLLATSLHFFDGNAHKEASLKEFFDLYELVLQKKYQKESLDDHESKELPLQLKTNHPCELQLSKIYTNEIFSKFQCEVEMMMSLCSSVTQVHVNGSIITYMVKDENNDFEVMYDRAIIDLRCACSCFNLRGYLCRHALCVLNFNNEDVPEQYILSRWRKDFKRLYVVNIGSDCIDTSNPIQWFEHLYRQAIQVAEEGMRSKEHYAVAWQAFKESLNKVRLVGDKYV